MKRITLEDFGTLFTLAIVVVFGWLMMLTRGASLTNPIDASTLSTIGPIVTFAITYGTNAERPNALHIVGIIVAFVGAMTMLIDRQATFDGNQSSYVGDSIVAISVVAAAIHTTLSRSQSRRYGALMIIACYFSIGFMMALPPLWEELRQLLHRTPTPTMFFELLYIALFGTTLPIWLLYAATPHITPTAAAAYRYTQPLLAIFLAIIRGQTTPDDTTLLGIIVIVFGVILIGVANYRRSAIESS